MRILLVPSTYHPILGGVQTVTHNLAQNLVESGHDVQVVTNRYPRSLPAREVMDGISVRRLLFLSPEIDSVQRGRADLFLASFYFYPSSLWHLRNLMRTFRPEVVNVHFPDHQIHFVLALRQSFQFRLIVSLHGHEVERVASNHKEHKAPKRSAAAHNLQLILREADAVTACSQHLLDEAVAVEPSIAAKAQVIHNGIDPKRFIDKSTHFHPRPYALSFGRLTHKKGFDLLLKAFAQAEAAERGIDLIIAGKGEEQNALMQQARELGLEKNVHFRGQASPEEVVRLLNGSLFVVVPSRCEPFGIVALEALAAGKPVLATRTGGLAEFLSEFGETDVRSERDVQPLLKGQNSSDGFRPPVLLVDPTAKALAKGLRQILELSSNTRELDHYRISDKYSWEHVAHRYENVLLGSST
ncbi:MAG TPA: glycosyltransferase family 4 protein [Pyrinomonadaceae bacterium]|nr:glycosyltransferase family 4 protein [Pyrinomonadaceae bacterium]